jgi:hypothetical protein
MTRGRFVIISILILDRYGGGGKLSEALLLCRFLVKVIGRRD